MFFLILNDFSYNHQNVNENAWNGRFCWYLNAVDFTIMQIISKECLYALLICAASQNMEILRGWSEKFIG